VAGAAGANLAGSVTPQIGAGGLGTVGGWGSIFTDFGCYTSYAFCIAGCVWDRIKNDQFGAPVADALGQYCVAQCDVDLIRCKGGLPPEPGIP
jgi:hypothetical protein